MTYARWLAAGYIAYEIGCFIAVIIAADKFAGMSPLIFVRNMAIGALAIGLPCWLIWRRFVPRTLS